MVPVYYALKEVGLPVQVCATLQHDQLLLELLDLFEIVPDYNCFDIFKEGDIVGDLENYPKHLEKVFEL